MVAGLRGGGRGATMALLLAQLLLAQLPATTGGSYCQGDTGTTGQHFHPCEPASHDIQCQPKCADGYKCATGCPGDASQGGDGSSVFKCDKHSAWQAWDAHSGHPDGWKQMICEKKVPCASLAAPPFDNHSLWQPGSSCAEAVAGARIMPGGDTDADSLAKALAGVRENDGTQCAGLCGPGYYRVDVNGTSGDTDATSGPTVTATCVGGTWTSPLESKQSKNKSRRGPCVKDKECSTTQPPRLSTVWHDKSLCAEGVMDVPSQSVCDTVCREGFYRRTTAAIMNLTCMHGLWVGSVGECVVGDAVT